MKKVLPIKKTRGESMGGTSSSLWCSRGEARAQPRVSHKFNLFKGYRCCIFQVFECTIAFISAIAVFLIIPSLMYNFCIISSLRTVIAVSNCSIRATSRWIEMGFLHSEITLGLCFWMLHIWCHYLSAILWCFPILSLLFPLLLRLKKPKVLAFFVYHFFLFVLI